LRDAAPLEILGSSRKCNEVVLCKCKKKITASLSMALLHLLEESN
jgi:hypothetical protein